MGITTHPDFDNHEMVVYRTDNATGLCAFIAIHDTTLRLSRGMTYKYAASGLPYGGAKAVIIGDANVATPTHNGGFAPV